MAKYSKGKIAIPNVTGNIVINITAVESAVPYKNVMSVQSSNLNKRYSGLSPVAYNGCFVCDDVSCDITKSCPVIFKNFASSMGQQGSVNYNNAKLALKDENHNVLAVWYIARREQATMWECAVVGSDCVGDLSTILNTAPQQGTMPSESQVKYVSFSPCISSSTLTMDSLSGLEIQMLDES